MPIKPAKPVDPSTGTKGRAAGTLFVDPTGYVLLLLRSSKEGNYAGHWGLPGGGVDDGESDERAATREAREEMGDQAPTGPKRHLHQCVTPNDWTFTTFAQPCDVRFAPVLNEEHTGFAWAKLDMLPAPIHPSIEAMLKQCRVKDGVELHAWAGERVCSLCGGTGEIVGPGVKCDNCEGTGYSARDHLAMDEAFSFLAAEIQAQLAPTIAFDRAPEGLGIHRRGIMVKKLAFDKAPQQQTTDDFERLHAKRVPITRACVNPYYGREIPKGKELGLDPDRVYRLLRDPKEIEKGSATSHNVPLLSRHVPHSADDHDGDITVGTVGSESEYEHPYLYNSLAIWSRDGRDLVDSEKQKELSSAYSYDADMTPGTFEGEPYDGVMRNMKWNHVCLVKKGRAGSDVALDEALQPPRTEISMSTKLKSLKAGVAFGAVTAALRGVKLAQDAAIDLGPAFAHLQPGKFKAGKPKVIAGVKKALVGKLAQDSDLPAIVEILDNLLEAIDGGGGGTEIVDDAEIPDAPMDEDAAEDVVADGGNEAIKAYLKSKGVPDDVIAGMPGGEPVAEDKDIVETENGPDGKTGKDKGGKDMPAKFDKGAMDAAIAAAETRTIQRMNAVQTARDHVFPVVGKLEMAFDSAEGVYHQAFKLQDKDMSKVKDLAALKMTWDTIAAATPTQAREPSLAMDADAVASFEKQFPNMAKVKRA